MAPLVLGRYLIGWLFSHESALSMAFFMSRALPQLIYRQLQVTNTSPDRLRDARTFATPMHVTVSEIEDRPIPKQRWSPFHDMTPEGRRRGRSMAAVSRRSKASLRSFLSGSLNDRELPEGNAVRPPDFRNFGGSR